MEETEGEEDKVEDGVSIKHCSNIKPDKKYSADPPKRQIELSRVSTALLFYSECPFMVASIHDVMVYKPAKHWKP